MRVAIVGAGISGLTAAWLLSRKHDVTVFEANEYLGGHTNTVEVETSTGMTAVDTGFIVFNDWTYPCFIKLLSEWGVASQPSNMSFSVQDERSGLEYNGTSLNTLFAQRVNLFKPSFYRLIRAILRFNKEAPKVLDTDDHSLTLGDYLRNNNYPGNFIEQYIVPMGAAIWSAVPETMLSFPVRYFVQFFKNHGMLSVDERPQWRVVRGGSWQYVQAWSRQFTGTVHTNTPVQKIVRRDRGVGVVHGGAEEPFDAVVVAAHSDQALKILSDPSIEEQDILGAIPYQRNVATLHTDVRVLPRRRLAWASWNYHLRNDTSRPVAVTYNMNMLQSLKGPSTFCVTLNYEEAIEPGRVLRTITYDHPVYTAAGVTAQKRKHQISGVRNTYYCGAYWGYGFHEDGVRSALDVAAQFGESL